MSHDGSQVFRLRDGRYLGYTTSGDRSGKPLLFLGGFPGSRLDGLVLDKTARRLGLQTISIDRPGFGLSDFQPGRKLTDLPSDITQLADHLKLNNFAVLGASGGSPYTLACASMIPEKLVSASVVSPLSPTNIPRIIKGMNPYYRFLIMCAPYTSLLLRLALSRHMHLARHNSAGFFKQLLKNIPSCDRKTLLNASIQNLALATTKEAFRNGIDASLHEAKLLLDNWEFDLGAIQSQVIIWQGSDDEMVPPAMANYLASKIPNSEMNLFENEGHCSLIINKADQILGRIAASFPG